MLFISLLLTIPTGNLQAVTTDEVPLSTELGTKYTEQQIQTLVNRYSLQYNVSSVKMMKTLTCESGYIDPKTKELFFENVQSRVIMKNGKQEGSWGVSQINLYWNNNVSKSESLDPYYSIEFMARRFSEGYARHWSCFNKYY